MAILQARRRGARYLASMLAGVVTLGLSAPVSSAYASDSAVQAACNCSITLSPVQGIRGTTVTVAGTGFSANHTVTLQFVSATGVRTSFQSAVTGNHGGFHRQVKIPAGAAFGHGRVVANDGTHKASKGFLVKRGCDTKAVMSLQPNSGKRGSHVRVSGHGFCPDTLVRIRFRDSKLDWTTMAMSVPVDGAGAFSSNETIPSGAAFGAGYITVFNASSDQGVKKPFTVKR